MVEKETVVHIGENSPEFVALKMTRQILFSLENHAKKDLPRKLFLDTYAECLKAVKGLRDGTGPSYDHSV